MFSSTSQNKVEDTNAVIQLAAVIPKYSPLLYCTLLLLLIDLLVNSFSELIMHTQTALVIIYFIQDVCIMFTSLVVLIMLINTYMFQAGLMGYMIFKFKLNWIISVLYLALCLGLQIWLTASRWNRPLDFIWTPGQIALYVIQRVVAVVYYFIYKRTAYRLSDSRFYEDSDWLRKEFEKRH